MRKIALLLVLVFFHSALASVKPKHIVMIVFENVGYDRMLAQPYFNKISEQGILFKNFYSATHPSQPNYLAMIGGETFNVKTNFNVNLNDDSIVDLIEKKSLTWKAYAESYPGNCNPSETLYPYVRKHNPFMSFNRIRENTTRCNKIVNSDSFFEDIKNNTLPNFSFFIPNNNNNGHDTGVAFADKWFLKTFENILNNKAYLKDTLFIITADEAEYNTNNKIYMVALGMGIKPRQSSEDRYDFYSILRTIEDLWGLDSLNKNDVKAASFKKLLK